MDLSPFSGWIGDEAVERLRATADWPDFAATRYEIDREIGRGGMGVVFAGRDRELNRDVAIKVTTLATTADAERLREEARTLARLEHPGIVAIHDVGVLPDGRVFTVMRLVRGDRLDARVRTFPLLDRLRLFDRVCDTIAFAHAQGVVHRDLKPANIMVGAHGEVLVLDWGLAAAAAEPAAAIAGTAGYMAPETRSGQADFRSDVYALGAVLRDWLPDATKRVAPLLSIVRQATATEPARRYQTVAALAADVRRFADGAAVIAHPDSVTDKVRRFVRLYRLPLALVLAYLAMRTMLLLWTR